MPVTRSDWVILRLPLSKDKGLEKRTDSLRAAFEDMKADMIEGNAVLDSSGEAWVALPPAFDARHPEFRYQLTAIGAPGPSLYIAEEVHNGGFKIAGGQPGSKVSWRLSGVGQSH